LSLTDISDVTETTTSEEITQLADQLINEIDKERGVQTKSDAQIANEHSGPASEPENKTTAETNSGSSVDNDEEASNTESDQEWIDDAVKAEAAAYGISDTDLAVFESREELDKVFRLLDKKALEAGRKAMTDGEGQVRNEKGQFAKKEEEVKQVEQPPAKSGSGRFEITLTPEQYDEPLVRQLTDMRDHYESRIQVLESHFAKQAAIAEEQQFDSFVDSMGHPDIFGLTGKETATELQRRKDLIVAVKAQRIGLSELGLPSDMSQQLVARVANMVFGEELSKKELKQRTKKISKQSDKRMGGGPTKAQPPSEDPRAQADRLYRELSNA